jgi:hypothetical protein
MSSTRPIADMLPLLKVLLGTCSTPSVQIESKSLRWALATLFLSLSHQSSIRSSRAEDCICQPHCRRILNQTSLLYTHPTKRWSIVSSSYEQKAHEPSFCSPCRSRCFDIQHLPRIASHRKKAHLRGALIFHTSLAPNTGNWPTSNAVYVEVAEYLPLLDHLHTSQSSAPCSNTTLVRRCRRVNTTPARHHVFVIFVKTGEDGFRSGFDIVISGTGYWTGDCSRFKPNTPPLLQEEPRFDLLPDTPYNMQIDSCCKAGVISMINQDPANATYSSSRLV